MVWQWRYFVIDLPESKKPMEAHPPWNLNPSGTPQNFDGFRGLEILVIVSSRYVAIVGRTIFPFWDC